LYRSITQIDWQKIKIEIENLQEDIKKYKSGILLWAEDTYPNYMIIVSALFGSIFDNIISSFLPGMKKVVDEYFTFHYDVKARNSKLYLEEIQESNKLVFEKNIQPMDILVAKDAYIKNFNQKFAELSKIYSTQVYDYSGKIEPILFSFGEQMNDFLENKVNINSKTEVKLDIENAISVSDALRQLKKLPREFLKLRKISRETNKSIRRIQTESLSRIPELNEEFKSLIDNFIDVYSADDALWVYLRLLQIKDVDSFHIHFSKFIARLFHILSFNNKNYPKYIRKKHYEKTREMVKDLLESQMRQKYPSLSNYLRSIFDYNKYRKIEAHHAPRIRLSSEIAYISIPGTNKEIPMNLKEINSIISTYSYFIHALGLPKP